MKQNEVFDLIITLLKPMKNEKDIECVEGGNIYRIYSDDNYLLNQTLRRYYQGEDKILISEKAKNLWNQLFDENQIVEKKKGKEKVQKIIRNFSYNDKITVDKKPNVKIDRFSGNKKTLEKDGLEIEENQKIQYNDIFHDEHIIPLEMIINELKEIENPEINEETYKKLKEILDKIYICKMLKSEDRDLMDSRKRNSTNVVEVVEINYWTRTNSGVPIEIVDWENIKRQIKEKQKVVK